MSRPRRVRKQCHSTTPCEDLAIMCGVVLFVMVVVGVGWLVGEPITTAIANFFAGIF